MIWTVVNSLKYTATDSTEWMNLFINIPRHMPFYKDILVYIICIYHQKSQRSTVRHIRL